MAHDPGTSDAETSNSNLTNNCSSKPVVSSVSATPHSTGLPELIVDYGHDSQIGFRPTLEDTVLIEPEFHVADSKCTSCNLSLFAVFDGHAGKECAEYCTDNYSKILSKHLCKNDDMTQAINNSISEIDDLCLENAQDGSGSTATILVIDRNTFDSWVINIGDSRCIKVCDNNGNDDIDSIEELSIVHQPGDRDEKLRIEAAGSWVNFGRVMGILAVSRALGDLDFKQHIKDAVISTPSIKYQKLTPNDKYILVACDGLFDVYDGEDIQTFIDARLEDHGNANPNLDTITKELATDAIRRRGSRDNVTCILVTLQIPDTNNRRNEMSLSDSQLNTNLEPSMTGNSVTTDDNTIGSSSSTNGNGSVSSIIEEKEQAANELQIETDQSLNVSPTDNQGEVSRTGSTSKEEGSIATTITIDSDNDNSYNYNDNEKINGTDSTEMVSTVTGSTVQAVDSVN